MSIFHSEELNELATALCAAQAEFTAIPKDSTNPFFKSHYAGLPKVIEVASPILTKHGLAVSQFIGTDETGDTLTTWLLHKSGQFIAQSMRLHLTKADAQGQGSATTYARRYSYMSVLGLVADEDDDGRAAQHAPRCTATPPNTTYPLPTTEDVEALKAAAKGLTATQIEGVLKSCGVQVTYPFNALLSFQAMPQNKTAQVCKALSDVKRP